MLKLRPYQEQAVYLLDRSINARKHPLCIQPTGSGKSVVLAALLQRRDQRALVLSHVAELLEQDAKVLKALAPGISQSFYAAGLGEKKLGSQVVFGSVHSVYRNLDRFRAERPLILIDEAHLCPRDSDAMYARVFQHFPRATRIGFTATAMRVDSGSLTEGDDAWFNHIACEVEVKELIDDGYLLPLTGIITESQAILDDVGTRMGDFIQKDMQQAVMRTLPLDAAVQQACSLAQRRRSWLVFAAGIEHAEQIEKALHAQGIAAETIFGDTDSAERRERIARFRDGKLRALVNVGVLTTGFDAPALDCIIAMRPTRSPVLWQQILGRGMRLSPATGKKDCLLLDFVGNLDRLGGCGAVLTTSDARQPGAKRKPAAPKRRGAPREDPTFFDASHRDPMSTGEFFDAQVESLSYFIVNSRKQPGRRMLVANYTIKDTYGRSHRAKSFLSVEFAGAARYYALQWFGRRQVAPDRVPHTATDALVMAQGMNAPTEVTARFDARLKSVVIERERFA